MSPDTVAPALAAVRRRMAVAWALALVFGTLAVSLAAYSARTLPRPKPFDELAYYPSGRALVPATFGNAETAADLAWLRAVQYYGEHRQTDLRFRRLDHVFDILTTLAPRFESPYVFGAFSLAQEGRDFKSAEALMLKGLEANPKSGRLAFELGFLYYVRPGGRDLKLAAEYFEQASHLPGSPADVARFAAFARQNSGDLVVAMQLWAKVRDHTGNRYLRDIAEREIARIRESLASGRRERAMGHMTKPSVLLVPA